MMLQNDEDTTECQDTTECLLKEKPLEQSDHNVKYNMVNVKNMVNGFENA